MEVVYTSKPWRHTKVTWWSSPNAHGSYSCHSAFSLLVCTYGIKERSLWSIGREREFSGLVYTWFCKICRYHLKAEALSETSLKENPPREQYFKQCIWFLTFIAKRIGNCLIIYQLSGCGQWFGCQGLGRNKHGKLVTIKFGEEVCR